MKTMHVVLWLTVVLLAGCATGKNGEAAKVRTVGELYTVRKIALPVQKAEPIPFEIKVETSYSPRSKRELVPAMVACEYLESIAAADRLPLRVREGLVIKRDGQWHLAELPFEKGRRHGCLPPFIHYAVWKERK